MKNLKRFITGLSLIAMFFISGNLIAQENNPYNEHGLEHNKALEYFYNELKEINQDRYKQYSKEESKELVLKLSEKYFNEISSMSKSEGMPKDIPAFLNDIIKFPPPLSPTFPEYSDNENVSKSLHEKTRIIFDFTLNGNSTALEENVRTIQKSELGKNDKIYLLVINSIGYNSLDYWTKNGSKWMRLSGENMQTKAAPPWARIGAADVAGGIVGAITGGSVSFGVLAVPGWVVGAGGTSLVQGAVELVDWLW